MAISIKAGEPLRSGLDRARGSEPETDDLPAALEPTPSLGPLPKMSVGHSLSFWLNVALPTWLKGIIIRRPWAEAMAERLELDTRAVRTMDRLCRAYGGRSALVRNPIRPQAVLLNGDDVGTVLAGTPEPFSPASDEKIAALSHFGPELSLITRGPDRAPRRHSNEQVLETSSRVHSHAEAFRAIIEREIGEVLEKATAKGELDWPSFAEGWFRMVRCIVLGPSARGDVVLSNLMERLRGRANWAFMMPKDEDGREELHARLRVYVNGAEPSSLAAMAAAMPSGAAATHQMTQWLFAFDPAGMTTLRALALIATHREALSHCLQEVDDGGNDLAFLRACILETLRLYPTTPAILRQATLPALIKSGELDQGTGVLIYTPFFHRAASVAAADRFEPARWLGRDPEDLLPFVPFSAGDAGCPGKNFVPMIGAEALRRLLTAHSYSVLQPAWLMEDKPLRGTLNHFAIRFRVEPVQPLA